MYLAKILTVEYSYKLHHFSEEMIYKQIDLLRHKTGLKGYILEIQHGICQQLNFEIVKDTIETNFFRPVFFGKYLRRNEEWELGGRFGYDKFSKMILLASYSLLVGLLVLCLIMSGSIIIASGIYCVISLLVVFQFIAYLSSTKHRNEILGIIEYCILNPE